MKLISALLASIMLLAACNTIRGAGEDIQKGGEKVQDAATDVQKKM
jgi:predicted small secreted protein